MEATFKIKKFVGTMCCMSFDSREKKADAVRKIMETGRIRFSVQKHGKTTVKAEWSADGFSNTWDYPLWGSYSVQEKIINSPFGGTWTKTYFRLSKKQGGAELKNYLAEIAEKLLCDYGVTVEALEIDVIDHTDVLTPTEL